MLINRYRSGVLIVCLRKRPSESEFGLDHCRQSQLALISTKHKSSIGRMQRLTTSNSIPLLLIHKLIHIAQPITRRLLQTVDPIVHVSQLLRALRDPLLHIIPVAFVLAAGSSGRRAWFGGDSCRARLHLIGAGLGDHALAWWAVWAADEKVEV